VGNRKGHLENVLSFFRQAEIEFELMAEIHFTAGAPVENCFLFALPGELEKWVFGMGALDVGKAPALQGHGPWKFGWDCGLVEFVLNEFEEFGHD
jgi:hypothetical protein